MSLKGNKRGVDWDLVERARQLRELKAYLTNIGPEVMDGNAAVGAHHALWQVEKSLRMAKCDDSGPVGVPSSAGLDRGASERGVLRSGGSS